MKRILVSLLAILYLAAGSGFTLREHYCMGEMTGVSVEHTGHDADSHRCDRCGMVKKNAKGCCKDQVKTFKSSPDQSLVKAIDFSISDLVADLPPLVPVHYQAPISAAVSLPAAPTHGPPLASGVPLYLRVRCLRL